jgi:DNA-directed RNA polymerase II subunit RPB1
MNRTKCNDIATILKRYGIEAARQLLLNEFKITYGESSPINYNHLSVLVDQMCHLGEIISIDRHGMNKIESDPLAKASFEKTMEHFINAAIYNEKDTIKSISSRIATGRVIAGGTGAFDLILDTNKLIHSEYTENETGGRITFIKLEENPLIHDIMKYENSSLNFFVPK